MCSGVSPGPGGRQRRGWWGPRAHGFSPWRNTAGAAASTGLRRPCGPAPTGSGTP